MVKNKLKGGIFDDDVTPVPSVPLEELTSKPVNPVTSELTNELANQPTNQVTNSLPNQLPNQPTSILTNTPANVSKKKEVIETKLKGLHLDKDVIAALEFWSFFEKEEQSKLVNILLRKHIPKKYFEMSR